MYPYHSHPARARVQAARVQAARADHASSTPGQSGQREPIDPARISLDGIPSLIQVGREIGVMVVVCLAIAVAGTLYAHFIGGH